MVASAFAALYTGAKPVFVDSDPYTWNIDPEKIQEKISGKTKAILVVHIYGHPCEMNAIMEIAEDYGLRLVEDAAEAIGAEFRGKKAGSFGDMACFSFYANKIITTGEGGMIVTDDRRLAERSRMLGDMAFIKERRFYHPEIGFNYRLTNLQAAVGLAQLERIDELVSTRRKIAKEYNKLLRGVDGITLPPEADGAKNVYWMYSLLVEDDFPLSRDELMAKLAERGVETRPFFYPLHRQPFIPEVQEEYPVADALSVKGINLPSGATLTEDDIAYVVEAIVS
jgi:perosamine synthetase